MSFPEKLNHFLRTLVHLRVIIGYLLFLLILVSPPSGMAAKITLNPNIEIRGEYNDNLLFARTNEKDDYIATRIPAMTLEYATELFHLKSKVSLDILRYADETNLNTENQRYELDADYQVQERTVLSGGFSYIKDTTLESELQETGLVTVRAERKRMNGSGRITYQLSELSDIGVEYTYSKIDYDWPGNIDYDENRVEVSYNRQFNNQRDLFTVLPYYSHTSSEASVVDNYGLSFGLSHMFSETITLTTFLGGRYSDIEYSLVQAQIISDPSLSPPFRVVYIRIR